jgi:oxygen-independent coproporphyrinogen-3 oxidase
VDTIYFGGGTPSILKDQNIDEILQFIRNRFALSPDAEITLESNPDDMAAERIRTWKGMGINRLSIGIQSFFNEDLKWMNRAHDANQALRALEYTLQAGFSQFSVDLIYGSPGLTQENWAENLRTALSFHPPHISCYALTVELKTSLYRMIQMKKSPDVRPDIQVTQFISGIETLESAGYEHYEISSFAKPGSRSRHNSAYWHSKKYLGLGPSAHSFDGRSRRWNISNNAKYIKSVKTGLKYFESEILEPRDLLNEYIMTSLRTMEGLDLQQVYMLYGFEKAKILEQEAETYIRLNRMKNKDGKLILTREGKLFADGIAAALFFD